MVKMTPAEYAKHYKRSISGVTKAIREKRLPKDVIEVETYGRFYLLKVNTNKTFKRTVKNKSKKHAK